MTYRVELFNSRLGKYFLELMQKRLILPFGRDGLRCSVFQDSVKHNLIKRKVRCDLEEGFDGEEKLSILLMVIVVRWKHYQRHCIYHHCESLNQAVKIKAWL